MAVPKAVGDVPRPKNTVVIPYGKDKAGFAVRARTGCKYKDGSIRSRGGSYSYHSAGRASRFGLWSRGGLVPAFIPTFRIQ